MKNLGVVLIMLLINYLLSDKLNAQTINFSGTEMLCRPAASSVTINVVPDTNIDLYYQFGTISGGSYSGQTTTSSATGGQPHNVVISGLNPDTRYYYRMVYTSNGGTIWVTRSEHSFHTQRLKGSAFTFTIIADSHMNGGLGTVSLYQTTLNNVIADNPDFHLDLGDTFWTDGTTDVSTTNQKFMSQRGYMGVLGSSSPIFIATGNHENEEGWNFDDANSIALRNVNARKRYYPQPVTDGFYSANTDPLNAIEGDHLREDYYAWKWGDALFVVIDPYQYTMTKPYSGTAGGEVDDESPIGNRWNWTLGLTQFDWLKNTLEESDAKFKFVFAHHMVGGSYDYVRGGAEFANLFEWGGYNADINNNATTWGFSTERPGWGDVPIHQLMVANKVSAFFYGHDHEYAYQMRDGVVYQLVPAPSMTGYGFGLYNEGDPHTIRVLPNSGHIRVSVTPELATVDYIATSGGTVNYSYIITPANSKSAGDMNSDNSVNSTDALVILSCDAGIDVSQFCPVNCGDANGDGLVNSTDALIILSYDAGMSVPFPVGQPGCPSTITPCAGCTSAK